MSNERSPRVTPLATAVVASALVAAVLVVGEQALSGFGMLAGLGGEGAVLLLVHLGVFLAFALLYGLGVATFLGGLRRTIDVSASYGRLRERLRSDPEADLRATATLLSLVACLLLIVGGFFVVYAGKNPEFLAKGKTAGGYFAFFVLVLLVVATLAFFPLHHAIRTVLRALGTARWFRSPRLPLAVRVLALGVTLAVLGAGAVLAKMLGDYEMRNVLRFPLFLLVFVLLHAGTMIAVYGLRARLGGWLRRTGVAVTTIAALAVIALPVFALGSFPAVKDRLEEQGFYGASVASVLRRVADLDRDGYSAVLDGGDCDDFCRAINPDAAEEPGDGLDNDCRDGDALPGEKRAFALDPSLAAPTAVAADTTLPNGTPKPPDPTPPPTTPAPDAASVPDAAAAATPTPPPAPGGLDRAKLAKSHVFVILVDTVRADHVHHYGYERETTPNIDALAKESLVFRRAYAQANHTPRSMPSIFTGRYPSEIAWDELFRNFSPIKESNTTLFEVLKGHGFTTLGVFAHWYFDPERRLNQGFDVWDNKGAKTLAEGNTMSPAPLVTKKALAHIEELAGKGQRIAAFIHYMDPHSRYMTHPELKAFNKNETLLDKYDGEIYWTDNEVGKLVEGLKRLGLYDDSVIIVLADHGEAFKDHKSYFHGMTLYREEIEVPLLIRVPGVAAKDVTERVALVDVFPTVLDLVGAPFDGKVQGVSLLPVALEGRPRGKPVYAELCKYPNWPEDIRALYVGDLKIIWNKTKNLWELFDLATDPREQKNVFRSHPKAEAMKRALLDWMDTQLGD